MTESWVIMNTNTELFVRFPPAWTGERVTTSWTIHINKARSFPSEGAALAVRSEWDLEEIARVALVCPSED